MDSGGSQEDFDRFLETRNFAALDGLRALAVFLVFTFHFGGPSWDRYAGWLGVYAFFVLSGFLITTLLVRERRASGTVSLKAFYIRRATRILPLYFLVYFVVLGLCWRAQDASWDQMKAAAPYHLLLLNELADFSPIHMTWTLGIEWKYYLVWPALFMLFGANATRQFGAAVYGLAALLALWWSHAYPAWLTPWHYAGMLLGSALAIAMHTRSGFRTLRPLMTNVAVVALALALVVVHRRADLLARHLGEPQVIGLYCVLVALLLPALLTGTIGRRMLSSKALVFVGRRSYAMYLVQYLAAQAVIALLPGVVAGPLLLALTFGVALAASDGLYRAFEQPIIRWGHRWAAVVQSDRHRAPRDAAASNWRPLA